MARKPGAAHTRLSAPEWTSAALTTQVRRCLARQCGGLGLDAFLADCTVVLANGKTFPAHRVSPTLISAGKHVCARMSCTQVHAVHGK